MDDFTFDYLLSLAKDLKIKVVKRFTDKYGNPLPNDMPSASDAYKRKIIINMNWHDPRELSLILGHEISHVINGDTGICYYTSFSKIKTESVANKLAIRMIMDYYFDEMDPETINIDAFMDYYAIPHSYYDYICSNLKENFAYIIE